MKKRTKRRILIGTAVVVTLAVSAAAWDWHLRVHYAPAVAKVMKVELRYVGEFGRIPHPSYRPELTLEYSVNGVPVIATVLGPSGLKATAGDTVRIRFRKARPEVCFVTE
jgi:hypothetical protein